MNDEIAALAARIDELHAAMGDVHAEARKAGNTCEAWELKRRYRVYERQAEAAANRLVSIFTSQRGWHLTEAEFSVGCLAAGSMHGHQDQREWRHDLIDHTNWFRKNRHAVAVAGHLYDIPGDAEAWARENGLKMTVSDFPSWHSPRACKLVIYTPALQTIG